MILFKLFPLILILLYLLPESFSGNCFSNKHHHHHREDVHETKQTETRTSNISKQSFKTLYEKYNDEINSLNNREWPHFDIKLDESEASSSHGDQNLHKCPYCLYNIKSDNIKEIIINKKLIQRNKYYEDIYEEEIQEEIQEDIQKNMQKEIILFVSEDSIGEGGYSSIYHAHWKDSGKCVALKEYLFRKDHSVADNELEVLKHFADKNIKNDYIIEMIGYQEKPPEEEDIYSSMLTDTSKKIYMYIVLELGGINLDEYYSKIYNEFENKKIFFNDNEIEIEKIELNKSKVLISIIKCAAKAIHKFHKYGMHLDIKATNFVIPQNHNLAEPLKNCKLIDFNSSRITNDKQIKIDNLIGTLLYAPPEYINMKATRLMDIYSFGVMIYKFLNLPNRKFEKDENLDRTLLVGGPLEELAKFCMEDDPTQRPKNMLEIINFLDGNVH